MRKAFTMIELTFVIVIIGILAAIALPKFNATRDDATLTKAMTTLASIRSAITQEAQRRQMEGNYKPIFSLSLTSSSFNQTIFDNFDNNSTGPRVLNYPIKSCKNSSSVGCWRLVSKGTTSNNGANGNPERYRYVFPKAVYNNNGAIDSVNYMLKNNRFICRDNSNKCNILEH